MTCSIPPVRALRAPRVVSCVWSRVASSAFTAPRSCRGFKTKVDSPSAIPDFAFAFEYECHCPYYSFAWEILIANLVPYLGCSIDGVLVRSSKPLPGASRSLSLLQSQRIPFILLTNGGGTNESDRIAHLNERLGLSLDPSIIIQSHTPFKQLVNGKNEKDALEDKCVLVVGGPADKCRHVAKQYVGDI